MPPGVLFFIGSPSDGTIVKLIAGEIRRNNELDC